MKVSDWLQQAQRSLEAAEIGTARLDALVLLEDELNKSRTHLLAHPEIMLTARQIKVLTHQLARRTTHEPLAYIRGKTEFYGREFIVTPAVLEPRPESETMIDLLKKYAQAALPGSPSVIADVGCGSGALGITAKLEIPSAQVDMLEIDPAAQRIAQKNVIKFATSISVIASNLLADAPRNYDILLCNLPYVPDEFHINKAAMAEPRIAIFGGSDGLDVYRQMFAQIQNLQQKPLLILCESLPPQHEALGTVAGSAGYSLEEAADFIQVFRLN